MILLLRAGSHARPQVGGVPGLLFQALRHAVPLQEDTEILSCCPLRAFLIEAFALRQNISTALYLRQARQATHLPLLFVRFWGERVGSRRSDVANRYPASHRRSPPTPSLEPSKTVDRETEMSAYQVQNNAFFLIIASSVWLA